MRLGILFGLFWTLNVGIYSRASAQCNVDVYEVDSFLVAYFPDDSTATFDLLWSTGDTTAIIGNLIPGTTYCVTATDSSCVDTACYYYVGCNLTLAGYNDTLYGDDSSVFTVQLSANISGGLPPFTYQWSPGLNLSDSTIPTPTATITQSMCYTLTVIDSLGCTGYANYCFVLIDTSSNCFAAYITHYNENYPNDVFLIDISQSDSSWSYFWDFGDGVTSSLPYPTHTYANWDDYLVCLTVVTQNFCTSSFCDTITLDPINTGASGFSINVIDNFSQVGIENPLLNLPLKLYPNPVLDHLFFELNGKPSGNVQISIVDVLGQLIQTQHIRSTDGYFTYSMDLSYLPQGIYFLNYNEDEQVMKSFKFLKK